MPSSRFNTYIGCLTFSSISKLSSNIRLYICILKVEQQFDQTGRMRAQWQTDHSSDRVLIYIGLLLEVSELSESHLTCYM